MIAYLLIFIIGMFIFLKLNNLRNNNQEIKDNAEQTEEAILAGGDFWCLEDELGKLDGVRTVESGYTGDELENPTYKEVANLQIKHGHVEAVRVKFDPKIISYQKLLNNFWVNHDPFDGDGQFCNKGNQYTAKIFYLNEQQLNIALRSKEQIASKLSVKIDYIKTEILPKKVFWLAKEYHQDYAEKNPLKYNLYRNGCGRDQKLKKIYGDRQIFLNNLFL